MPYKLQTINSEIQAVDIHTMTDMSEEDYKDYLENVLFDVDHHDILRTGQGGPPLAVKPWQVKALIEHLKKLEPKIGLDWKGRA